MFRNCLAAALRHLAHSRLYTALSIGGLAVGIAAGMLAALVPRNELSQDHFIPGHERIYMAITAVTPPGHATVYQPSASNFVAPQLALRFSEIEAVTRLFPMRLPLKHERVEALEDLYYADPNALDVLQLPVLAGNPHAALARPDGVVMNLSAACKYFGRDLPLGETLLVNGVPGGPHALTVGAVITDLPPNSTHLRSGVFISAQGTWTELHREDVINVPGSDIGFGTLTYVKLAPHASPAPLLAAMPQIAQALFKRPPPGFERWKGELQLVRLDRMNAIPAFNPGFWARLLTIGCVGGGVLLIALINFVNLQTALAARRAREAAIRQVAGCGRPLLMAQFLTESVIYVLIATLLGTALTEWLLPSADRFLSAGAAFEYWRDPALLGSLIAGAVAIGLIAGLRPAWQLSRSRPAAVLKGAPATQGRLLSRQLLVALQFAALIGLILGAGVIYLQRHFATQDALRVDTRQMLLVRGPCRASFLGQVRQLSGVRGAACSHNSWLENPTGGPSAGAHFITPKDRRGVQQLGYYVPVDASLLALYGIKPVAGELPPAGAGRAYVLNETSARRLGFTHPAEALGFALPDVGRDAGLGAVLPVTAVVPDFTLGRIDRKIEALAYLVTPAGDSFNLVSIKLAGPQIPQTIAAIDGLWRSSGDGKPANIQFLDAHIQGLYLSLLREAQLLSVFAAVAVALGCLGLLGLAASITHKRSREIGIRKALGADTGHVLALLLRELTRPVLWANLIAWPAAAWTMQRWLEGFAYHVALPLWLFPAAAAMAVLAALLTIIAHAARAARTRPVAALRYE